MIESDDEPVSKESAEQMCFKLHQTCWYTEKVTVKLRILAYVCWILLVLLLSVAGCCLALAKGGDLRKHCTELDCYLSAIKLAVQLQGRDSDAKSERIPTEESWNFALSDQHNDIDTVGPLRLNNCLLNLRPSMPSQYTLTSTFQTALVATVKCAVPNTSAFQQTATSAMHQIDISNAMAIEMSAAESLLRQESNTRTPVAPAEAMVPHQSAADRPAESKGKRCGKKQSNNPRISSTETEVMVSKASKSSKPGSTQCSKFMVVTPESSSFTPSRCDTPLLQLPQTTRILLGSSRSSRKRKKVTF